MIDIRYGTYLQYFLGWDYCLIKHFFRFFFRSLARFKTKPCSIYLSENCITAVPYSSFRKYPGKTPKLSDTTTHRCHRQHVQMIDSIQRDRSTIIHTYQTKELAPMIVRKVTSWPDDCRSLPSIAEVTQSTIRDDCIRSFFSVGGDWFDWSMAAFRWRLNRRIV